MRSFDYLKNYFIDVIRLIQAFNLICEIVGLLKISFIYLFISKLYVNLCFTIEY